jgi:multidrug resistance efflux pump
MPIQTLHLEQERQNLEEERQQIAQIRKSIDQQRLDLEAREAKLNEKLNEIEPLIPILTNINSSSQIHALFLLKHLCSYTRLC